MTGWLILQVVVLILLALSALKCPDPPFVSLYGVGIFLFVYFILHKFGDIKWPT